LKDVFNQECYSNVRQTRVRARMRIPESAEEFEFDRTSITAPWTPGDLRRSYGGRMAVIWQVRQAIAGECANAQALAAKKTQMCSRSAGSASQHWKYRQIRR